jgi:hypothetical protein
MKRISKLIRWIVLPPVLLGAAAAGIVYFLASRAPARYHPADLTWQERSASAKAFAKLCMEDFFNPAQARAPFSIFVSEAEINRYFASMDEIEGTRPGGRPGEVHSWLQRAGLAGPAVAIGEGVFTVMVRLVEYGKILSADLSFDFLPDGRLQVRLREIRVGQVPVPEWLYRQQAQAMCQRLASAMSSAANDMRGTGISPADVSALLAPALGAINQEPISTVLPMFRQRISAIELHDGKLALAFEPVDANAATARPSRIR